MISTSSDASFSGGGEGFAFKISTPAEPQLRNVLIISTNYFRLNLLSEELAFKGFTDVVSYCQHEPALGYMKGRKFGLVIINPMSKAIVEGSDNADSEKAATFAILSQAKRSGAKTIVLTQNDTHKYFDMTALYANADEMVPDNMEQINFAVWNAMDRGRDK